MRTSMPIPLALTLTESHRSTACVIHTRKSREVQVWQMRQLTRRDEGLGASPCWQSSKLDEVAGRVDYTN